MDLHIGLLIVACGMLCPSSLEVPGYWRELETYTPMLMLNG
jgi:hypothetical protein